MDLDITSPHYRILCITNRVKNPSEWESCHLEDKSEEDPREIGLEAYTVIVSDGELG